MMTKAVALNLDGLCVGRHGQAGQCAGGFAPHALVLAR